MTWETKGKGKGYYQYIPGWAGDTSSWGWGEAKGKGKGKPSNARKGKGMDKDLTTIEACHAAILEGKAENKKLQAEAAKAINQSKQLLANLNKKKAANDSAATGSAAGEGELLCPKCGAAHHNLTKIRCRMTNCRAVLQPKGEEIGNQTAEAKLKKPKDPVQSNFMQALLARHNAKELLLEPDSKSGAKSPMDAGATSEASQDVEMAEPTLDHDTQRSKLEGILKTLKDAGAPAATIRAQEQAIAALPKPKPEKPLMDAAHFSRALSQAQEYHQSVAALDAKKVEACQAAIVKAQADMQTALQEQQEHAQYAELAVTKLRSLIAKTQSEVTQVIPAAKPQESPDFKMLMAEFLNSIDTNLKAAPHLKAFIENVDFVPRASAPLPLPLPLVRMAHASQPKARKQRRLQRRHPSTASNGSTIASGADGPREPAQGKDLLKMLKDMLKMLKDLLIVSGADGPREPAQGNKAEMNNFTGSMYKATFTTMLLAVTLIFIILQAIHCSNEPMQSML